MSTNHATYFEHFRSLYTIIQVHFIFNVQ